MINRILIFWIILLTVAFPAWAINSAEIKLTLGPDYYSFKTGGGADLDSDGNWNADLAYSRTQYTDPDTAGWNNLYFLELNYFAAATLSISGNYSYACDNENVSATGPGFCVFYSHFVSESEPVRSNLIGEEPGEDSKEAKLPADLFTVGMDSQVLFYQAEAPSPSALPAETSSSGEIIRLTQFLPSVFLDFALIPGRLNVNASGSYSLYSDDPAQIAANSDTTAAEAELASLDSLMAGLFWTSWHTGASLTLPYTLKLSGNYGKQKQVYPEEWVENYDLSLSGKLTKILRVKLTWCRFTSSLGSSDLFTAGLRLVF